ncbi:MAG: hypothetical protein ACYC6P_00920 [Ignavibacteriaceae bacterium]
MIKIYNFRNFLASTWIKVLVWILVIVGGLFLIAALANYLTVAVFHL